MKKIYLILIALPFLLHSCLMEDNDIFSESAAERMSAALKHHQEVLTGAANGWVMEYYPERKQSYGGYTLFMKFEAKDKVTIASERGGDKAESSMYQLIGDSGPVLTFNTHNSLFHYFSDPRNPDGIGPEDSGMGGDYEFLVLESTSTKVTLKGKKTGNRIIMTPMAAGDHWGDKMKEYQDATSKIQGLNFSMSMGELKGNASISYRTFDITYPGANSAVESVKASYRILPTDEIEFYEPLKIAGKEIAKMKFSVNENEILTFIDVATGFTLVEIVPTLNEEIAMGNWYFAYSTLGLYGKQRWDIAKPGLAAEGEDLYSAWLEAGSWFSFRSLPYGANQFYAGAIGLTCELIGDDQVKLTFKGDVKGDGKYYYQNVVGFSGYMSALLGQFTLKGKEKKSPTEITFQDNARPTNTFTLHKKSILFPYDK